MNGRPPQPYFRGIIPVETDGRPSLPIKKIGYYIKKRPSVSTNKKIAVIIKKTDDI